VGVVLLAGAIFMILRTIHSSNTGPGSERKMLAVLPFENLGTPDQEYFADGITEEITSKLSGLSGLGVIARSSALQYKKTTKSLKQIGDELGVSYVLQGTIRWENSGSTTRVRVNPQLINVADGTQIWSQPSEAVLASAFNLQSEVAGEVANALDLTLLQTEKKTLEAKLTENSEAFDSYLRGNQYLTRSTDDRDYRIAEQMYERAVELDPKFAEAYAKLGALHSHIYWEYYDHTENRVRMSKEAAEKALQLDPNLPDGHGAMGWYYYHGLRDFDNALREFNLALKAQPDNADLLLGLGSISRRLGKFDEALSYFQHVVRVDPLSAGRTLELGITCIPMRRYAEAERYLDRTIGLAPDLAEAYYTKGQLHLLWKGKTSEARAVLDGARQRKVGGDDPVFRYFSILVNTFDGKYAEAVDEVNSAGFKVFQFQYWYIPKELILAQIHSSLGKSREARSEYDAARLVLEREVRQHPDDARLRSSLGIAYAGLGRKADAIREGRHAVDNLPITKDALIVPIRMQDLAQIYMMTGDRTKAIQELDTLLSIPSLVSVPYLRIDPLWKPLANDARFQKMLAEK
jgi:serine/threonine-protein kinase